MLKRFIVLLVLALLLSGCITIMADDEPKLPRSQLSELDPFHSHGWMVALFGVIPVPVTLRHETAVIEVDGIEGAAGGMYLLRPGQHMAKVRYIGRGPVDLCGQYGCVFEHEAVLTINLVTKAGREYRILGERSNDRNWVWVEDVKSGEVVGGEKPPARYGKDETTASSK